MILSSLLSAGAFGLAAQAFLVIPEANNVPQTEDKAPATIQSTNQVINLDCSSCPYALNSRRNGVHEWTGSVASELELNFASTDNTLKLNDVVFYPIQKPTPPPRLAVSQKKKDGEVSTMEGLDGKVGLDYSMEYTEKKFEQNSLVTVIMTIMGLEGQMIKVDNVEIKAIKEADGKLTLHSVTTVPASPNAPDAKCTNILCRVFTKLITGVHKAKASAKGTAHRLKCICMKCFHKLTGRPHAHHNKGNLAAPHRLPDGTIELPSHVHFRPMRPQHIMHHHKGFFARMGHVLRTTVKVVMVPVLIGVAFGMAASAIGMLVGQVVVFLWLKFRKTEEKKGGYERVETDEKDAPPAYQDVQGVEAISEKEVEQKA